MFSVKDTNIFPMPGNSHMIHTGTISEGLREYVVMICMYGQHSGKAFVEEVVLTSIDWEHDVYAHLKFIDDDNLANELVLFAKEKGMLDPKKTYDTLIDTGKIKLANEKSPFKVRI